MSDALSRRRSRTVTPPSAGSSSGNGKNRFPSAARPTPLHAAELILTPRPAEFCAPDPGVRLDMVIDGLTDVVAKGFDVLASKGLLLISAHDILRARAAVATRD